MKLTIESLGRIRHEFGLSPRELQLLELLLEGRDTNAALAARLGNTTGTVKQQLHGLYLKFHRSSKLAVVVAVIDRVLGKSPA